jgi:hypothetical protein
MVLHFHWKFLEASLSRDWKFRQQQKILEEATSGTANQFEFCRERNRSYLSVSSLSICETNKTILICELPHKKGLFSNKTIINSRSSSSGGSEIKVNKRREEM